MKQIKLDKFLNKVIIVVVLLIILVVFGLIYNTLVNGYSIELKGSSEVIIYLNNPYYEPGYVAYNRSGKDVTSKVKVISNVDIKKEGNYQIIYQIGKVKVSRNVIVKYDMESDITLTLEGANPKYILKDITYSFEDCRAYDKIDGDITSKIVIDNKVDFNREGEYEVEYTVTNTRGTTKSIIRKVIVYDIEYVLKKEIVNNKCVINLSFNDEYYKRVKLPDGTFNISKDVNYTFTENGEYILEIYDKYDNHKNINIVVSEIDKVLPSGSCVVNLYDLNSKVDVTASDNNGVKGYVYSYGSKKTEMINNNSFSYTDMVSDVKVTIYDMVENSTTINCVVKDLSTSYSRSYTSEIGAYNYKLYIPGDITKRSSVPLVIFLHGMGECGNDLDRVNANSFPKYISEGVDYDFIMAAPQLPNGKCGSKYFVPSNVKSIIDYIINNYPIDSSRVVITGFSLGGINTYSMLKAYPTFFAGAIPLSGATTYDDSLLLTDIWAHNGNQNDGAYREHKELLSKITQKNPNSKFTEYDKGHNITDLVYKDLKVIEWIMNARRK